MKIVTYGVQTKVKVLPAGGRSEVSTVETGNRLEDGIRPAVPL